MDNKDKQTLYYLHGALHLFQNTEYLEKYVCKNMGNNSRNNIPNNNNPPLIVQIQSSIKGGKLPLFITEGSKKQKQSRIQNNAYLDNVFSSLKEVSQNGGNIFVYGHSLRKEDHYVFERIFSCKNKDSEFALNMYIGYYDDQDKSNKETIISGWDNNSHYQNKNIKFYLFDSTEVKVWEKAQVIILDHRNQ